MNDSVFPETGKTKYSISPLFKGWFQLLRVVSDSADRFTHFWSSSVLLSDQYWTSYSEKTANTGRWVIDGISPSTDGFPKSIDGFLKSIDGFPKSIDGFPKSIDGFMRLNGFSTFSPDPLGVFEILKKPRDRLPKTHLLRDRRFF